MRLIPGKTKVKVELFKGISLTDMLVAFIAVAVLAFVLSSSLPGKYYIALGLLMVAILLLARVDSQPNYMFLVHILRHYGYKRSFEKSISDDELVKKNSSDKLEFAVDVLYEYDEQETDKDWDRIFDGEKPEKKTSVKAGKSEDMRDIIAFTDIKEDFIEYAGSYFGIAVEIDPVEFRFFSEYRRANSIEASLGKVLRSVSADYCANIVKVERPIVYDAYLENEKRKLDELRAAYEGAMITEEEFKARAEVVYERIDYLEKICFDKKVVQPCYYVVLFDSNKSQLENTVRNALDALTAGEMKAHRLDSKELAVFLKYTNQIDFDEREIENIAPEDYAAWAMPKTVEMLPRTVKVNGIVTHNMRVISFPAQVGDAWMAGVMSIPATKVVVKCRPMDHSKAVRSIDRSLQELRGQFLNTGVDSKRIELSEHIETLSTLLALLQGGNETLLEVNVYVTAYDIAQTRTLTKEAYEDTSLATITNMKRVVRRVYSESTMRLNNMEFEQVEAFIGSQVSSWDPMHKDGRGIPSNTIAAMYPWIYSHVSDEKGIRLGTSDGVPVFIDFFRRDSERVNSNMVIVGKSGSGKSYATKSLLANLAADNAKIFILDPENEYSELAENLHGKFINVGNAQFGRLNPFHIITSLSDDETDDGQNTGSYATHLQFLEEFFHQILPDCDKDAMEYLNSLIDRMYTNMGITEETNLSELRPEDYPTFDNLYDAILSEFQSTDNDYIRTMLRTLMNYVSKFSAGGRNANIWNGPSTITTEENFTVFNFQSLLANRNGSIANAQMLLVLKYIDNEIIKNRDYNSRYKLNRKIVVVIDEAHVFIDTKYPAALDFMYQLAKRIRKYNGMQIVITQNIKDFVGSDEIARKSTAIINACQYSFIFALSPNDMDDLCRLYEKAGEINEREQEQIISAARGQAFTIMSPQSRSSFRIEASDTVTSMFKERGFDGIYFGGKQGDISWEDFIGDSRDKRIVRRSERPRPAELMPAENKKHVTFVEMSEEEFALEQTQKQESIAAKKPAEKVSFVELDDDFDIPEIPETPEGFAEMRKNTQPAQSVPAAAPAGETERLLSELLGRFSHDAMMEEIRRSVREELEKEFAARGVQLERKETQDSGKKDSGSDTGMPAVQPDTAAEISEPESEEELFTAADDLFIDEGALFVSDEDELFGGEEGTFSGAEDIASDMEEEADAETTEDDGPVSLGSIFDDVSASEDADDEDEEDDFDLMNIIMQQATDMDAVSPIELMEDYGDTVLEVTLEELALYNLNMSKKTTMEDSNW